MKWSTRIRQLNADGWTYQQIGDFIGLSKSAIGDLATGRKTQPRGDAALKLDALHLQYCGDPKPKRARL